MNEIMDRLWIKAGEQGIPLTAAFELLPVCNLQCRMCYVRKGWEEVQAAGGLLPSAYWLEIARQSKELGLLYITLTGGEPLLHPEFRYIYRELQQMGMQVSINTNGTMIDRDMAAFLGANPPMRINLTLYGASAAAYERLCGNGAAFEQMKRAVAALKEQKVLLKFNASITPENVNDLDEMMAFRQSVDVPIQIATYMFPPYRRDPSQIGYNDRLSPQEAGAAKVKADYLQNEKEWFVGQAYRFSRFVDPASVELATPEGEALGMTCRAGHCSMWLNWQGQMSNCGMYESVIVSVADGGVKAAWEQLREKTHAIRYAPGCMVCPNRLLCHSCIAMVHNECGDLHGAVPTYVCEMNREAARVYREYAEKYYPEEAREIFEKNTLR